MAAGHVEGETSWFERPGSSVGVGAHHGDASIDRVAWVPGVASDVCTAFTDDFTLHVDSHHPYQQLQVS